MVQSIEVVNDDAGLLEWITALGTVGAAVAAGYAASVAVRQTQRMTGRHLHLASGWAPAHLVPESAPMEVGGQAVILAPSVVIKADDIVVAIQATNVGMRPLIIHWTGFMDRAGSTLGVFSLNPHKPVRLEEGDSH